MATTTEKRYNKVLDVIDKRLVPDAEAKKARGEVFTPLNLVREVLFGLKKSSLEKEKKEPWGFDDNGYPIDNKIEERIGGLPIEIWRDSKTTFLDPANGIGNFPVIAFYILDYQLGKHGKDSSLRGDENKHKRRKHIVENMLFMIELNKGNVNTSRNIFKNIAPEAKKLNIVCADSLKITNEKLNKYFERNTFDVIMGNPPFQPGQLWFRFIETYITKSRFMSFIVPSTFTSNQIGKKVLDLLKKNGLNQIRYLKESDFPGINLDMLYFHTDNKNNDGKILINNFALINYKEPIINYESKIEVDIFKKLKEAEHLRLYRGMNKTLPFKNPKETNSIKFKKLNSHPYKMLSRLGGGDISYYYLRTYNKEEVDKPKIVFPRGTGSYNNFNTLINLSKDIVFSTHINKDLILSDGIMYVPMEEESNYDNYKFYLMRSKIIRFVFLRVNHLSELTPFLFEYIPKIPISKMNSDENIFNALNLTEKEINYINNYFKNIKPIGIKGSKTRKNTSDEETTEETAGGARPNKTRKIKRS